MRLFSIFKRKPKEETAAMGMQGQPVQVISGTPHPDHYDRERNTARIAQLKDAVQDLKIRNHPKLGEYAAELEKHLKIQSLFHGGEEE